MRSLLLIVFTLLLLPAFGLGQTYKQDYGRQSARSDSRTGGTIVKRDLEAGNTKLKLTVNVPSFDMTLWQDGEQVHKYYVGVGVKNFPIFIGLRQWDKIIWNPSWYPPNSEWVKPALRGKHIKPTDPRNPLGKIKIPLGYGYLIHQAKGRRDLGNLVSHGCLRVLRSDLYDLNEKVLTAHQLDLGDDIKTAKRTKKTYVVELEEKVELEVSYDAVVTENGVMSIYPDVYGYRDDLVADVRQELKDNDVDDENLTDATIKKMIARTRKGFRYAVNLNKIRNGKPLTGKRLRIVPSRYGR